VSPFDNGTTIVTERLALVPLHVEDAEEMGPECSAINGSMSSSAASRTR
jgi:hypothetical protein